MIIRPRATSLRINSGSSFSRLATYCISSVITPCRARCICDMLRLPFFPAASASLFSTQLSRIAINSPRIAAACSRDELKLSHRVRRPATRRDRRQMLLSELQFARNVADDLICAQADRLDDRIIWFFEVAELSSQNSLACKVSVPCQDVGAHFLVGAFQIHDLHRQAPADCFPVTFFQRRAREHAAFSNGVLPR